MNGIQETPAFISFEISCMNDLNGLKIILNLKETVQQI